MRLWLSFVFAFLLVSCSFGVAIYSNGTTPPPYDTWTLSNPPIFQEDCHFASPGAYEISSVSVNIIGNGTCSLFSEYGGAPLKTWSFNGNGWVTFNIPEGERPVLTDKAWVGCAFPLSLYCGWRLYWSPTVGSSAPGFYRNWSYLSIPGFFPGVGVKIDGVPITLTKISGKYEMPGWECSLAKVPFVINVIKENQIVETVNGITAEDGSFLVNLRTSGAVRLCLKPAGVLSVAVDNVNLNQTPLDFGDVLCFTKELSNLGENPPSLGDDVIDDFEYNAVTSMFGAIVPSGSGADFNCDSVIDDFEGNYIGGCFGMSGDCYISQ